MKLGLFGLFIVAGHFVLRIAIAFVIAIASIQLLGNDDSGNSTNSKTSKEARDFHRDSFEKKNSAYNITINCSKVKLNF